LFVLRTEENSKRVEDTLHLLVELTHKFSAGILSGVLIAVHSLGTKARDNESGHFTVVLDLLLLLHNSLLGKLILGVKCVSFWLELIDSLLKPVNLNLAFSEVFLFELQGIVRVFTLLLLIREIRLKLVYLFVPLVKLLLLFLELLLDFLESFLKLFELFNFLVGIVVRINLSIIELVDFLLDLENSSVPVLFMGNSVFFEILALLGDGLLAFLDLLLKNLLGLLGDGLLKDADLILVIFVGLHQLFYQLLLGIHLIAHLLLAVLTLHVG